MDFIVTIHEMDGFSLFIGGKAGCQENAISENKSYSWKSAGETIKKPGFTCDFFNFLFAMKSIKNLTYVLGFDRTF